MTVQPGAKIEVKSDANITISSNVFLYDKEEWGAYAGPDYYFHNYGAGILTAHKNRGNGKSKELLDDAQIIVDGQLNITGKLYSTASGADVMGNGGGHVIFSALPSSSTTIDAFTGNGDAVSGGVTVNTANLHNEDESYTKAIASKTFHNKWGRWFVAADKDERSDHTYAFTYISSGAVSGTGGTSTNPPVSAVYAPDKTGLTAGMKWCNVEQDATCSNIFNAIQALNETPASNIRYTYPLDSWLQLLKTETEGVYGGSDNSLYAVDGCAVNSLGSVDENCLYTIEGVKKALVDGHFVALVKNDDDEAFHNTADAEDYYISFKGCTWHPATKYTGEEKAYIVEDGIYIWYNNDWLLVEREDPYFFDYNDQNVKRYYEYENGAWVLATPCVSVTDVLETRYFYFLPEAFTVAFAKKNATITLLKDVASTMTPISCTTKNTTYTIDLNGHTATATITGAGTTETKMFDINASGTTVTITDNSAEKNGKLVLRQGITTTTASKRWHGIYVTDGSLILDAGEVEAINDFPYTSTSDAGMVSGVTIAAGKTFTMTGGSIDAYCKYAAYGLQVNGSASANANINISGGTIHAETTEKTTAYGIYTLGGTTTISGGTIEAKSKTTTAAGIYVQSSKSGYAGKVEMTGGTVNSTSTTTTAYGILVQVNATGKIPAEFTMSGGTVNVTTGTYTAYGIYVARAAASSTNIYRAVANISGGIINVTSTTSPSSNQVTDGIHSFGTTTITGNPEINVTATKTYARGIRVLDGTTTISGTPTVTVRATQYAYGVAVLGVAPDANGICSNAELVINNGTFDVATTSVDYAYGAFVQPVTPTADYESPSTLTINDGHFIVKAQTTTAQGVNCSRGTLMAGTSPNTLLKETLGTAHINGGTFDVSTLGTTTAQGLTNSGNMTVGNATFNVTPKSTTAYGARCYHGLLTINEGTVFNVKATNTAYGIVAGYEPPSTKGVLYDAEVIINGGTINVETTSKATIYGLWAGGNSRTIATGTAYEGNYASAGKITVNDGEINVKAKTNPAYAVFVDAVVTQAGNTDYPAATATPQAFINGGKFKVTATSSKNYAVSATPLAENCQITGGYYNTHTTQTSGTYLDKYVVSPNKKLTLRSSHALYPDGYRYTVGKGGTVTWKNGETTLLTEDYLQGETPAYTGTPPTKTDAKYEYTHNGWDPTIADMDNSDATYSATFSQTEKKYSVSVAAGANGSVSPASVSGIGCVTASVDITAVPNTGYHFANWTLPEGVTAADGYTASSNPICIHATASGKTITANFEANTYTVTLDNQSATTAGESSVTATYGAAMPSIAANLPEKIEYTFDGYYSATNGGGTQYYNADGKSAHVWDIDGETTLYAKWTLSAVTIIWKNGDEVIETDEGVLIGATPHFDGETPTKATDATNGYTFDGWDDGTNVYAADALPAVSGPVTYTAHYSTTPTVASVEVGSTTTYYTDFAEAWDATNSATGEVTLKLLQDVSGIATSLVYTNAQNCTLDLNNHTILGSVSDRLLEINAAGKTFTIDDSSAEKGGRLENSKAGKARYYAVYLSVGILNLEHGTIHSSNPSDATYSTLTSNAKKCIATGVYVAASQTFNMNGGEVSASAIYLPIGIQSAGYVNVKGGLVAATATKFSTAYGIYAGSTTKIYDGATITAISTNSTSTYGIYIAAGTTTLYGGKIESYATSASGTTAIGVYAYKGNLSVPESSTVDVIAKSYGKTCYGVQVAASRTATIKAGSYAATSTKASTASGVYSLGTTTISGGTFTISTKTTNAYGVYATRGKITVNGSPIFNVTAGSTTAYGAFAYGTVGANGKSKYSGTIEINGGTFNVTTTTTTAYGAYAGLYSRTVNLVIPENAADTIAGQHYMPGIISITDGTFNVKAKTTAAYGIVVAAAKSESGAVGTTTRIPTATITGGKFKVESAGDDNATAYAMNSSATATNLKVQGGKYSTKRTNASETSNIEDKYTAPKKDCNYHVLPLTGEDPYKYEVAEAYTITFKNGDDVLQSTAVKKGTTPTYNGETPAKEDESYTYSFTGWSPAITTVSAAATYTATFSSTPRTYTVTLNTNGGTINADDVTEYTYGTGATLPTNVTKDGHEFGGWFDNDGLTGDAVTTISTTATGNKEYWAKWTASIVDRELDIVDWTSNSITINVTNLKAESGTNKNNWKIYVNDKDYTRTSPECSTQSRTLTISVLSLKPNENLLIQLKNDAGVIESQHNYKIPQIYTANATLSGTNEKSVVYVYGGKLAISGNTTLDALYVCPGAEVEVTGGTLTVGKLVLRTKPWATAAISGSVEATNIYYTRIAPDGSVAYPTGQYYQFGLPYECAISAVRLSDGTTPAYNTTWILKSYNEEKRAANGATGENWDALAADATIEAGRGYEMLSTYKYYREYYFPVIPTDNTSVAVTRHGTDKNNSGWNIVCSPLMSVYENKSNPVDGLKVSWLLPDGSYDQAWPEIIWPAKPFSYQASATGYLDFSSSEFNQTVSAPRRAAYKDNIQTEWLHLDVKNANGVGDHTSIFAHPDRFDATYETGIDVAKQSFTASRALIYSSHVYGEMAFAGLPDSLLEHGVALTVYSPINQELTISMRENNWLNRMAYVLLIDKETGAQVDLMNGNYTFEALEGTMRGRFFIQCVFNAEAPEISTGVNHLDTENDKAQKIVYKNKIYIIYQGRVYDMTGRQCELQ